MLILNASMWFLVRHWNVDKAATRRFMFLDSRECHQISIMYNLIFGYKNCLVSPTVSCAYFTKTCWCLSSFFFRSSPAHSIIAGSRVTPNASERLLFDALSIYRQNNQINIRIYNTLNIWDIQAKLSIHRKLISRGFVRSWRRRLQQLTSWPSGLRMARGFAVSRRSTVAVDNA